MNTPAWVLDVTDSDLNRHFGAATVARGRQYAALGRVSGVRSAGPVVTASVRGSGYRSYHTTVVGERETADGLVATCSCPVRTDCKHAVALVLALQSPQAMRTTPGWQQILSPFSANRDEGAPLALLVSEDGANLVLRPLRPGSRGDSWVRTGAGWKEIAVPSPALLEAHRAPLSELHDALDPSAVTYRHGDALAISDLFPTAWGALQRALDAGVVLVAGTSASGRDLPTPELAPVALAPIVAVRRDGDALTLTPRIRWGDTLVEVPRKGLLGRRAHGAWFISGDRLVLGGFARPLIPAVQGLFQHGDLAIPPDDIDEFAAGYLPRVRRTVDVAVDDDIELPEPLPPQLLCRVDFTERSAHVHWGFVYRLGQRRQEIGLSPTDDRAPRDPRAERELVASVPDGAWAESSAAGRSLRPAFLTGRALIDFVSDALPALTNRAEVELRLNQEAPVFHRAAEEAVVRLSVTESEVGDWFDLDVDVRVGEEKVPLSDLIGALTAGDDHLMLDSGTWFPLDSPELAELRSLIEEARLLVDTDGDTFRLRPEHAGLWEELEQLGVVTEQAESWRRSVSALLDPESLPPIDPPAGLHADLRNYQATGFHWLSFLMTSRLGGILADEMGLGKTVQSLALIQSAKERGELDGPMLVVAPTSVIGTWVSEAARFAPGLRTVPVTATKSKRGTDLADTVAGSDIVVTSYTLLRLEADQYREVVWGGVLLDEAQFVKNHSSKAYQAVRKLRARVKIALTGTPLENNLMDLWSLLSITAPGLFPDPKAFTAAYRRPIEAGDADALARLHRRIRPLILRRTKAAVASELPEKQEQVVPVELSPGHRKTYDKYLARERQKVLGLVGDLARNRITILRSLTLLRQLSLSPALVDDSLSAASAKIDALVEMLGEIVAEGHRALVFSQFTSFLSLVRERFEDEGIDYEYLDGRTRDRAGAIDDFRNGEAPVFLISLKAGGFGLTLTEADYVFILDPWWNPAAENQAIDRTHRIGQEKRVNVYRLVAQDTIEEKVVALQQAKRDLFDSVVGTGSDAAAPLSASDIVGLLEP